MGLAACHKVFLFHREAQLHSARVTSPSLMLPSLAVFPAVLALLVAKATLALWQSEWRREAGSPSVE